MSADLVIMAAPTDDDWLAEWNRLNAVIMIGDGMEDHPEGMSWQQWEAVREMLGLRSLPSQWIGQVSWLKAGLFGDTMNYIPGPVEAVSELLEPAPILTPGLASAIMVAMNQPNRSIYGRRRYYYGQKISGPRTRMIDSTIDLMRKPAHNAIYSGIARRQHVKRWLQEHMGARLITESQ